MPNFFDKKSQMSIFKSSCYGDPLLNSRFLLDLSFKKEATDEKTAVVIMMNPSSTAKANVFYHVPLLEINDVDDTTRKVIKTLACNQIKYDKSIKRKPPTQFDRIVFLNLIPYYCSQPYELKPIYLDSSDSSYYLNYQTIDKIMKELPEATYFCAWLKRNYLSFAEEDIKKLMIKNGILNNTFCFDTAKNVFVVFNPYISPTQTMAHPLKWQ